MSYGEVIEETGNYRLTLHIDDDTQEPYDYWRVPVLRIDRGSVDHLSSDSRPTDDDDAVEDAVRHWGASPSRTDWRLVEKYLRAWFGTTYIETWYSGSYWYVAYDTAAWREFAGLTTDDAEHIRNNVAGALTEFRAWAEGDVWGYTVEQKIHVVSHKQITTPEGKMTELDYEYYEWYPTDESCWGYYGHEYATEQGKLAFEHYREMSTVGTDQE
jgi:hypothetical protein